MDFASSDEYYVLGSFMCKFFHLNLVISPYPLVIEGLALLLTDQFLSFAGSSEEQQADPRRLRNVYHPSCACCQPSVSLVFFFFHSSIENLIALVVQAGVESWPFMRKRGLIDRIAAGRAEFKHFVQMGCIIP
jgi:hypothetical protein